MDGLSSVSFVSFVSSVSFVSFVSFKPFVAFSFLKFSSYDSLTSKPIWLNNNLLSEGDMTSKSLSSAMDAINKRNKPLLTGLTTC